MCDKNFRQLERQQHHILNKQVMIPELFFNICACLVSGLVPRIQKPPEVPDFVKQRGIRRERIVGCGPCPIQWCLERAV